MFDMSLSYLHGKPQASGVLRSCPEDFIVEEFLPFEPSGDGEHVFLQIQKKGLNTQFVADELSKFSGEHPKNISYAGLKDKHAVTTQWFCVRMPGKPMLDWHQMNSEALTVVTVTKHIKKLKTGALLGNRFRLTLRDVTHIETLQERFEALCQRGVPNYFGEQRFGHGGQNLERAQEMFDGKRIKNRKQRSLYLSSVRSYLFNQTVQTRINQHKTFPLAGDIAMLKGTRSFFYVDSWDDQLQRRLQERDIVLSAPLWGRGTLESTDEARHLEEQVAEQWAWMASGLEQAGLEQERRPLLLYPEQPKLELDIQANKMMIEFTLPAGCFATSVLRELIDYRDQQKISFKDEKA